MKCWNNPNRPNNGDELPITQPNLAIDKDLEIIETQHLPITLETLSNAVEFIQYFRVRCIGSRTKTVYMFHIHPTIHYPKEKPQIFLTSPKIAFNPTFHDFQDPYSCTGPISFLQDVQWSPTMTIGDIWTHLQLWVKKYEQTAPNL